MLAYVVTAERGCDQFFNKKQGKPAYQNGSKKLFWRVGFLRITDIFRRGIIMFDRPAYIQKLIDADRARRSSVVLDEAPVYGPQFHERLGRWAEIALLREEEDKATDLWCQKLLGCPSEPVVWKQIHAFLDAKMDGSRLLALAPDKIVVETTSSGLFSKRPVPDVTPRPASVIVSPVEALADIEHLELLPAEDYNADPPIPDQCDDAIAYIEHDDQAAPVLQVIESEQTERVAGEPEFPELAGLEVVHERIAC